MRRISVDTLRAYATNHREKQIQEYADCIGKFERCRQLVELLWRFDPESTSLKTPGAMAIHKRFLQGYAIDFYVEPQPEPLYFQELVNTARDISWPDFQFILIDYQDMLMVDGTPRMFNGYFNNKTRLQLYIKILRKAIAYGYKID